MTVPDLLSMYPTAALAGEVCGLCRSAPYHWYNPKKMVIPSDDHLVALARHKGLTEAQQGLVLLDAVRRRSSKD